MAIAIPTMSWGSSSPAAFLQPWAHQISRTDPNCWRESCGDVYTYLLRKVFAVANSKRRLGVTGWEFFAATPADCLGCAVWADGRSEESQTTSLGLPVPGEMWWPCVILMAPGETRAVVPFYCPPLAMGNSRHWTVHVSRLRLVVGLVDTPGPTIEEVESDVDTRVPTIEPEVPGPRRWQRRSRRSGIPFEFVE